MSTEEVAEGPPGVTTVTSTAPTASDGEVALHEVVDVQETALPAVPPKLAVVLPVTKPVPVTVTRVPPASRPVVGLMAVTVGTTS